MVNNTSTGLRIIKQNIKPSTSAAGGTPGATAQDHYEYQGTVTLNGATPVTVTEPNITATSTILFTLKTVGGTVGAAPAIQTITVGTGFTVQGTALDTSVYNYKLFLV